SRFIRSVRPALRPGAAARSLPARRGCAATPPGKPARSADFASAIYRPKPSATMISSRGWGHALQKGGRAPISRPAWPALLRTAGRQWLAFDQIGLGIAKVLAHKKRRQQGPTAQAAGECALLRIIIKLVRVFFVCLVLLAVAGGAV